MLSSYQTCFSPLGGSQCTPLYLAPISPSGIVAYLIQAGMRSHHQSPWDCILIFTRVLWGIAGEPSSSAFIHTVCSKHQYIFWIIILLNELLSICSTYFFLETVVNHCLDVNNHVFHTYNIQCMRTKSVLIHRIVMTHCQVTRCSTLPTDPCPSSKAPSRWSLQSKQQPWRLVPTRGRWSCHPYELYQNIRNPVKRTQDIQMHVVTIRVSWAVPGLVICQ